MVGVHPYSLGKGLWAESLSLSAQRLGVSWFSHSPFQAVGCSGNPVSETSVFPCQDPFLHDRLDSSEGRCCPETQVLSLEWSLALHCAGLLRPLAEESSDFLRVGDTSSIVLIPVRVCVEGGVGRWAER